EEEIGEWSSARGAQSGGSDRMGDRGVVFSDDKSVEWALPARRGEESLDLGVGQSDQFLLRPPRGLMRAADDQGQVLAAPARSIVIEALPVVFIDCVFVEYPFDGRIEQAREFQVGDRSIVPEIYRYYGRRLESV